MIFHPPAAGCGNYGPPVQNRREMLSFRRQATAPGAFAQSLNGGEVIKEVFG
jgi:hypothetical protein